MNIEWNDISGSLEIDDDVIVDYVEKNWYPENVFKESALEDWARENGWVKPEEKNEV